jgi:putative FmdB family regulatory protein
MPLYEFDCPDCRRPFEILVPNARAAGGATCPACGSREVTRRLSTFSAMTASTPSQPGCAQAASCVAAAG